MKQLLLYGIFACCSISGMEEFNAIKALLDDPSKLTAYLESQDSHSKTPLMRLLDKDTDAMLEELLPLLKDCRFNREIPGPAGETAFFNACDRSSITAVKWMVYLGARADAQTTAGHPVYLAFYNNNLALLEFLISEGASPHIPPEVVAAASRYPNFARFKAFLLTKRLS